MFGEGGDIFGSFAEGGDVDFEGVDAEHQVFAEGALFDHFFEVAVGGADHADVDVDGLVIAEAADVAGFEDSKQLGLHREGELADFVQEDGPAVGYFELPGGGGLGAGDGAAAVSEEFAFDQVFGEGAAVDRDHRAVRAEAGLVQGAGDEFFAAAGFAADQDGAFGGSDFGDQPFECLHRVAVTDQFAAPFGLPEAVSEGDELSFGVETFGDAFEESGDFFERAGFGEVIEGLVFEGGDRRFLARLARHHDHFDFGAKFAGPFDHFDPGHAWHVDVDDQAVVRFFLEGRDGGRAVGADGDGVATSRQVGVDQLLQVGFVVGEEDAEPRLVGGA